MNEFGKAMFVNPKIFDDNIRCGAVNIFNIFLITPPSFDLIVLTLAAAGRDAIEVPVPTL